MAETETLDVAAIRARAKAYRALMEGEAEPSDYDAMRAAFASAGDIPALLDEVERLRAVEGVCHHQNARYLALLAERDALTSPR